MASRISPWRRGKESLSRVDEPSLAMSSIFTWVGDGTVTDFSLEKKSPLPAMEPTLVLESLDQAPMECGCFLA